MEYEHTYSNCNFAGFEDWQLMIATLIVTGISVVLLTLEVAVPQLRGEVSVEEDGERAFGISVKIFISVKH